MPKQRKIHILAQLDALKKKKESKIISYQSSIRKNNIRKNIKWSAYRKSIREEYQKKCIEIEQIEQNRQEDVIIGYNEKVIKEQENIAFKKQKRLDDIRIEQERIEKERREYEKINKHLIQKEKERARKRKYKVKKKKS